MYYPQVIVSTRVIHLTLRFCPLVLKHRRQTYFRSSTLLLAAGRHTPLSRTTLLPAQGRRTHLSHIHLSCTHPNLLPAHSRGTHLNLRTLLPTHGRCTPLSPTTLLSTQGCPTQISRTHLNFMMLLLPGRGRTHFNHILILAYGQPTNFKCKFRPMPLPLLVSALEPGHVAISNHIDIQLVAVLTTVGVQLVLHPCSGTPIHSFCYAAQVTTYPSLSELISAAPAAHHHDFPNFNSTQGHVWEFAIDPLSPCVTVHPTLGWSRDIFASWSMEANLALTQVERYKILSDCSARSDEITLNLSSPIYIVFCYQKDTNVSWAAVSPHVLKLTCSRPPLLYKILRAFESWMKRSVMLLVGGPVSTNSTRIF
jgi:hypothetical protein